MSEVQEKAAEFLRSHGMYHGDVDMEEVAELFLEQMEAGLAGRESSLAMIPTYIETGKRLGVDEPVIVMDAGGTNFRAAVVSFDEHGKPVIKKLRKKGMPGVDEEVSKNEFFDILAGYIEDIIGQSKKVGFCFSYPCEIFPNKDGKLIRFVKEIHITEIVGQKVGENLNAALERLGISCPKQIVILNDTVTALLAGMAGVEAKKYDSYAGFILGTGTNTCYIEQNKNITKVQGLDTDNEMIINVESGGFDKAPRGKIDVQFDTSTSNPGVHTFEKMISGAYLGPLCLDVIRAAVEDELFSSVAGEKLRAIKKLDTKQISDYLAEPSAACSPPGEALLKASNYDKALMEALIGAMVERAAKLTAINLSAIVLKSGRGKSADKPVCTVAEGTTFYSLPGLKEKVEGYLREFLVGQKGCYYEIAQVENATLIGAAIAGLTN
jgi:hexokinase